MMCIMKLERLMYLLIIFDIKLQCFKYEFRSRMNICYNTFDGFVDYFLRLYWKFLKI